MIRKSIARAFGSREEADATAERPEVPSTLHLAVDRLFQDLHDALGFALVAPRAEREGEDSISPGDEATPRIEGTLEDPHPTKDGLEFTIQGPTGSIRFVHTLRGRISFRSEGVSGGGFEGWLSVQPRGRGSTPVLKPLHLRSPRGHSFDGRAVPYRHTSVRELKDFFLGLISNLDTFWKVP